MMANYDVFNGDADGLTALVQLRLAYPKRSTLVTGVKRDIALLQQVTPSNGDQITVLDISLDKNIEPLELCLTNGASVFYADHHSAKNIPVSSNFEAHIHTHANTCTALIINGYLAGKYPLWAIVGAFGDNLRNPAMQLAQKLGVSEYDTAQLERLGIYLNYNGYGEAVSDLLYAPDKLFQLLIKYCSPLDFLQQESRVFDKLQDRFNSDLALAQDIEVLEENECSRVFVLPNEAWTKRVSGVYSNALANKAPNKAHAIITTNNKDGYLISIRAPLTRKFGAEALASQFSTGGGREAAAGINHLPKEQLSAFIHKFQQHFMAS